MQAFVFGLAMPVLPLMLRRLYQKERKESGRELIFRYVIYMLAMTVIATVIMVFLCDDNTSFLTKVDGSPVFALKFLLVEILAGALVTAADWYRETGRLTVNVDRESFRKHPVWRIVRKAAPFGIYVLAFLTVFLNAQLISDNVLWGDEAYSANLVRSSLKDILYVMGVQRESHPPLYYFWLRMWTELLGHTGPVLHFASFLLFLIGTLLTVTLVRKRYGKIPASFLLAVTGLSIVCVEYNVEVRMYAMAFLAVTYCYYCAGRILMNNRPLSWAGMVLWALIAAYSHYYALLTTVILMVTVCLMAVCRYGKKTWLRVFLAAAVFILGYAPWLQRMFATVDSVTTNWWMTEPASFYECLTMIFGGEDMMKLLLPFLAGLLLLFLLAESSILKGRREEDRLVLEVHAPGTAKWPAELYVLTAGLITVVGVLAVAYGVCALVRPLLARRYIYPLLGIIALMVVIASSHFLQLLKKAGQKLQKAWLPGAGKLLLLAALAAVLWTGIGDYQVFRTETEYQSQRTEETLYLIGEPTEDMVLVNNGVTHIGWTVLQYYYPDAEVQNTDWASVEADDFWYFTKDFMQEADLGALGAKGYTIAGYGEKQIAKYPFVLYHFYKSGES